MIRIINADNRDAYAKSLDQYFRLRYEIFVKELCWFDPNDQLRELDQYDDENAVYILSIDANDDVVGCLRIYPTTLPHMLIDHFGALIDGPFLQRSDVLEVTRFAIAEDRRRGGVTYRELYLGLLEYGLSEGVMGAVAVVRTMRISPLLGLGLSVRPLGLSHQIGIESNSALYYDVNEAVLARVRKNAGITASVLEANMPAAAKVA